jgi:uncharacterized RDD family membrane protein YckC/Tfp pilus assembly major pilin PilA
MQIHINRDGQNFGPYSLDEVRQYVASGNIVLTDLAWYEGAPGWVPLGQVPGVGPAARPAAAAPVAAPAAAPAARPAPAYRAAAAAPDSSGERRPAGFWKRVLALLIDTLVLIPVSLAFGFVVGVMLAFGGGELGSGGEVLLNLVSLVLGWLYFALMESSAGQGTIGKRVVGIVVTDLNGDRIGFGRATGRYFGKILSSIILLVGYLMAAFTRRKQGLHDMLAGTLVLNRSPEARDLPTWAIVLLLMPLGLIPIAGILLAIAIPAYHDYTERAKVAEILNGAGTAKLAITEFMLSNERVPESLDELGVATEVAGASLSLSQGVLVLTRSSDGATLGLEPYRERSGQVVWRCGNAPAPAGADDIADGDSPDYTSLPPQLMPQICR